MAEKLPLPRALDPVHGRASPGYGSRQREVGDFVDHVTAVWSFRAVNEAIGTINMEAPKHPLNDLSGLEDSPVLCHQSEKREAPRQSRRAHWTVLELWRVVDIGLPPHALCCEGRVTRCF